MITLTYLELTGGFLAFLLVGILSTLYIATTFMEKEESKPQVVEAPKKEQVTTDLFADLEKVGHGKY